MDIAQLVEQFGVTIGLLLFFVWKDWKREKEHRDELKDLAENALAVIPKNTEVITNNTSILTDLKYERQHNTSGGNS